MLKRAADGAAEGFWLRADRQDDGRGRQGRNWDSASGNLFASTIVRLRSGDPAASGLAFVAGVAVHAALMQTAPGIAFMLKWPNDILHDGAKLCGMLLERQSDAVIVGIGVNLLNHPTGLERPVTSLRALGLEPPPPPQEFAEILAGHFEIWLGRWRMGGLAGILNEWRKFAHAEGSKLEANLPDGERLSGHYIGVDDDGAIKLRLADGSIRAIHAGDIFLI